MSSNRVRWLAGYPRAVPVAIFLLVCAITLLGVAAVERSVAQRESARMREVALAVASALERRAEARAAYLRAGAAMLSTSTTVEPARFRAFVDELRLGTRGTDPVSIGWAEMVAPREVPAFLARMKRMGIEGFRISPQPAAASGRLAPVTILQPETPRSRSTIGFDLYSEPVRRAAMDEAERTAAPFASGRVILAQEGDTAAPGFLVFMPVFDGRASGRELRGFIFSPLNAQHFLVSALRLEPHGGVGIALYDGAVVRDRLMAEIAPAHPTGQTVLEPVTLANRPFLLAMESSQRAVLAPLSMLTLLFGLAVASLLMLIARLMARQALEDRAAIEWLAEQHSIRNTLTRELNHRVKNTLANVLSIISLTRRRAASLDEFADGLEGRVRALSATHDLLTESDWGSIPVRSVIEVELVPSMSGDGGAVTLAGPDVEIAPNDALSLGLAMHELVTNAARHGALRAPGGRVEVRWQLRSDKLLEVVWTESGGPEAEAIPRRGFGIELIEKIVAHELRQPVDLQFAPGSLRCTLLVPVRAPAAFAMRAQSAPPPA